MNYDQYLTDLINGLTGDKSLAQPYKNYLISDAKRLQVAIRGTKTVAIEQAPADDPELRRFPEPKVDQCICKPLEIDNNCPAHGQGGSDGTN